MKKKFLFIILFGYTMLLSGQVPYTIVYKLPHSRLPIRLRSDNSGVYGIAGFSVTDSSLQLLMHDKKEIYSYRDGNFSLIENKNMSDNNPSQRDSYTYTRNQNLVQPSRYSAKNREPVEWLEDGKYQFRNGTILSVRRENSSLLTVNTSSFNTALSYTVSFKGNLGYADFIGNDSENNIYLIIEEITRQVPMEVSRSIIIFSPEGQIKKKIAVPLQKYIAIIKEFEVDAEGNIYQFLSDNESTKIIKWETAKIKSGSIEKLPEEFEKPFHYNFLPVQPEKRSAYDKGISAVADRATALRTGETYVNHRYTCTASNLAPSKVRAADGDTIQTPPRLVVGANAEIPYKWGGFMTLSTFDAGLSSSKYAGDIDCNSSSSYAVGVDCSGFLSKCWGLSSHIVTADLPDTCKLLASWDSLRPADAVLRDGHVRMFVERTSTGAVKVVESSGRDWGVSYWTYALSDLTIYAPYVFKNMSTGYNGVIPVMQRVLIQPGNIIRLNWTCDTSGLKGFRLYKSTDGTNWALLKNETTLKNLTIDIPLTDSAAAYRISSVKNDAPTYSESFWSNVLSYSQYSSPKKILLVDGFTRLTGNWRGPSNEGPVMYMKALKAWKKRFDSVRNSELLTGINLLQYDAVIWLLGDESTANATFSDKEQVLVKQYLENGGSLFVSGSEIGYDLYEKGSTSDKQFYTNYLKAVYMNDDAASLTASGVTGGIFDGCTLNFGQTYAVPTPDEINASGGAVACLKYDNSKGAGIAYTGKFGTSAKTGRLIYLGFPLETTANDSAFQMIIGKSLKYLSNGGNYLVKFIPEGYYDIGTKTLSIRDTFKLYLANTTAPYSLVDSCTAVLDSATFTAMGIFGIAPSGTYYLVIRGRNILETWSKISGNSYLKDGYQSYDFSSSVSKAYGSNLIIHNTVYCIYSGDVNQDGSIDFTDMCILDNDSYNYAAGYLSTDVNGDGSVDFLDMIIVDNNSYNYISSRRPDNY
ncbi:MAG: hypothetical protein LWX56_05320 [Ignavibacteria bacterium]|nr:hypothetical protein [Ignavibacteria bacterium]